MSASEDDKKGCEGVWRELGILKQKIERVKGWLSS